MQQNLGPGTVITTYTYDAANQLDTAQQGSTTWHYTYDANGSLISDGAKTYTYDSANRLTQVSDQSSVVSMDYNGLGQRVSMDASGVIAHYVMDGDQPLMASSNGNTTFYLYGLGAIAEKTNAWSYSLPDGTNTPRQLSNLTGSITLSARYTPWGDTLDTYGNGDFTFGYFGGVMDAATGLLYVGNGQCYDPATGRFLTRDAKPNNSNPYVPWDPTGAIIGPLGVAALFFGRKRKRSKWDTLIIIVLLGMTAGISVVACGPAPVNTPPPSSSNTAPPVPVSTQSSVQVGPGTVSPSLPSTTPSPIETPTMIPCPTPLSTSTPSPIPTTDEDYKRLIEDRFGIIISNDTGAWATAHIQIAYSALSNINTAVGGTLKTLLGTTKSFLRDWNNSGYSGTTYLNQINFHINNSFPHQLIYHEMGHLLNISLGNRFTYALDHGGVYDENGNWVMGRDCPKDILTPDCKEPYERDNWLGYRLQTLNDPSGFSVSALMHGAYELDIDGTGASSTEDWGDLFANYVAGNIDLNVPAGRAKYKFVVDHLY